jgi:two-component system, OmpR family, response regulator
MLQSGPSQKILVVDDDRRLCGFLARFLGREGYSTTVAHDGTMMGRAVADDAIALVLLDLAFPGADDGFTLARSLRAQRSIPLILLTGRSATNDKVVGLELGADDYVTKPFEPQELLARIRAVLRRAAYETVPEQRASSMVAFGGWRLDLAELSLHSPAGDAVPLTSQEFALLTALALRLGRVLSREQLVDLVSNRRWNPYDRSIDLLVSKIRQKMGDAARGGTWLKTVRGRGYVLVPSR